jgi:hypothetical protein
MIIDCDEIPLSPGSAVQLSDFQIAFFAVAVDCHVACCCRQSGASPLFAGLAALGPCNARHRRQRPPPDAEVSSIGRSHSASLLLNPSPPNFCCIRRGRPSALDAVDGSSARHASAMDVGAAKAPTIRRHYLCKRLRLGLKRRSIAEDRWVISQRRWNFPTKAISFALQRRRLEMATGTV